MILSCPNCASRFRVDADKLGMRGRKVRCAKCGHTWHASPDDGEAEEPLAGEAAEASASSPAAEQAESPSPQGAENTDDDPPLSFASFEEVRQRAADARARGGRRRERPERHETSRRRPVVGWSVFILVVAAILAGAWFGRHGIVERFPRAAGLYDLVGISVNTVAPGLELRNVRRKRETANGTSFLVISGEILNTSDSTRAVPGLKITLFDAAGQELVSWRVNAADAALPPGGRTTFRAQRANPPDTARELSLMFARPE